MECDPKSRISTDTEAIILRPKFLSIFFLLTTLISCGPSFSQRCQVELNDVCYDKPKISNPPIKASWHIIDVETKKPIPGVWISFYWLKFSEDQQKSSCARNVIGQTDAMGRFSDTARDGSWMFTEVFMFKLGYQPIQHERLVGQTFVTDKHSISGRFVGKYRGWENELLSQGYKLDRTNTTNNYYKNFELGSDYQKIMSAAWQPDGETQYWVSKRGIPDKRHLSSLGIYTCSDNTANHDVELVGYKSLKYDAASPWNYEMGLDAYETLCDARWDLVPASFQWTDVPVYLSFATKITGKHDNHTITTLLPDYTKTINGAVSPRMSAAERLAICSYLSKYTTLPIK